MGQTGPKFDSEGPRFVVGTLAVDAWLSNPSGRQLVNGITEMEIPRLQLARCRPCYHGLEITNSVLFI